MAEDRAGGREKAPAALCRKTAIGKHRGGKLEIWGDGEQTRSVMYTEDCLDGLDRILDKIMACEELNNVPVNLARDRMVSINELAGIIGNIAGVDLEIEHVDSAIGVRVNGSPSNTSRSAGSSAW